MSQHPTVKLDFERHTPQEMHDQAEHLFDALRKRRTVRTFSSAPIPMDVVRRAIHTAGQSPSGANKQPWTFALITDPGVKAQIREAAEAEERSFYAGRASQEWLDDLAHLGTDANKPFLTEAPALIVVFAQSRAPDGGKHYYVKESVGIACGVLLAALHMCGLATLTHTPSPMGFLQELLERPDNERAYMIIPVGYPAEGTTVPDIDRKPLEDILVEFAPS
mgnify:CR=1 FL=1